MKKRDWYAWAAFPGFTNRQKIELLELGWRAEDDWQLPESAAPFLKEEKKTAWEKYRNNWEHQTQRWDMLEEGGMHLLAYPEEEYPEVYRQLYEPPAVLFYKGRLPSVDMPLAAIVGARDCSAYGREMAEYFARSLAERGIGIVSGLAYGIDSAAHRGALQANGYTLGILGTGADVCYPQESKYLYEHMICTGGVLSEFLPGAAPLPYHFPQRNRLISGLASCLLVMEAKKRSGSFITVEYALEQGKEVFALPGRVGDVLSEGCNRLIRSGAALLQTPEQVVEYFENFCKIIEPPEKNEKEGLAGDEKLVYSCLDLSPRHFQVILEATGLSLARLAQVLLQLEQKEWITQPVEGFYVLRRK